MLVDDPAVLVGLIDDLGEIPNQIADISVGDDHQLVQGRYEARIGGLLAFQALRVELVGEFLQLVFDAGSGLLEGAAQETGLIGGDAEGDSRAATRRVLISHEESTLLVVRPSVGVTAPAGGRFVNGRQVSSL